MKKITIYLIFFVNAGVLNAQELKVNENHKGILNLKSSYQIFPENRIGNNLYGKDGKLLKNYPQKIIIDALEYNGYLFFIIENEDKTRQPIYQKPNIKSIKFIASNYIQLIEDENVSFLYYNSADNNLENINIPYKSAKGFVHNQENIVAFYRIIHYAPPDPKTSKEAIFTLQVSILNDSSKKIIDIANSFKTISSTATLQWLNKKKLAFSLREGIQEISIP